MDRQTNQNNLLLVIHHQVTQTMQPTTYLFYAHESNK